MKKYLILLTLLIFPSCIKMSSENFNHEDCIFIGDLKKAQYQIPVDNVEEASTYYQKVMGFKIINSTQSVSAFLKVSKDNYIELLNKALLKKLDYNIEGAGAGLVYFTSTDINKYYYQIKSLEGVSMLEISKDKPFQFKSLGSKKPIFYNKLKMKVFNDYMQPNYVGSHNLEDIEGFAFKDKYGVTWLIKGYRHIK
jgi:hypothetical protein